MKKVGIVTFHFPTNYGAKLQCTALLKYLREIGIEAEVIDYRPKYHTWKYAYVRNPFYIAKSTTNGSIKEYINTVIRFTLSYGKLNRLKKNIKSLLYDKEYFIQTDKFDSMDSLSKIKDTYDAIIVGSDQIWNYNLTNGDYDGVYFAQFASNHTKKIAYAPSSGSVPDLEHMEKLVKLLSKFDALSVREESLQNALLQFDIRANKVVDPTFLLSCKQWIEIERRPKTVSSKDFICVYSLFLDEKMISLVNQCSIKYNCKVIDLSPTPKKNTGWTNALTCDPSEFLWYIHNAQMVIADSFHALVFSIIFHKQFISFAAGKTTHRLKDLLEELHLSHRIFSEDIPIDNYFIDIDYNAVEEIINANREESALFLKEALGIET